MTRTGTEPGSSAPNRHDGFPNEPGSIPWPAKAGRMAGRRWADDGAEAGPMTGPAQDVAAMVAGRPALLQDACRRALAYLDGLAERRVAPDAEAVAALDRLDFPLPGPGLADGEVLRMLDELGS